jgi:hypothetical protein
VQIVGQVVELVDGLGSFLSQPALPLASVRRFEIARGGAERHLARPQRHPRPPGKPLDLGRPTRRLSRIAITPIAGRRGHPPNLPGWSIAPQDDAERADPNNGSSDTITPTAARSKCWP